MGELTTPGLLLPDGTEITAGRSCRLCGCTDERTCLVGDHPGKPCTWVEIDLCSACLEHKPSAAAVENAKALQALRVLTPLARRMVNLLASEPTAPRLGAKAAKARERQRMECLAAAIELLGTPEEQTAGRLEPLDGEWRREVVGDNREGI